MQHNKQNYFQLFGIDQSFDVDVEALAAKYRQLQSESHPDRFAASQEAERLRAVQTTSLINEAYDTLKAPLSRAGYLLQLHGEDSEKASQADLGMDLLMEQMQLREALDELPDDESALPRLEELKEEVNGKFTARQQEFASHIEAGELQDAKRIFHEMQFLHKLLREIDQGEEQRLGY